MFGENADKRMKTFNGYRVINRSRTEDRRINREHTHLLYYYYMYDTHNVITSVITITNQTFIANGRQ